MEEMIFICEGEEVSIETMCEHLSKTKSEILEIGYSIGNKKTFKIDEFKYKVLLPHGNLSEVRLNNNIPNKKKSYYKKVLNKHSGGHNKKFTITNMVKNTGCMIHKRKHYLDGKIVTKEVLAKTLNMSDNYLSTVLARIKSVTINGHDIIIKADEMQLTPIKDGVKYTKRGISECVELSKISDQNVRNLHRKKTYSAKEGWRFL